LAGCPIQTTAGKDSVELSQLHTFSFLGRAVSHGVFAHSDDNDGFDQFDGSEGGENLKKPLRLRRAGYQGAVRSKGKSCIGSASRTLKVPREALAIWDRELIANVLARAGD
jgi:hypothetical protein